MPQLISCTGAHLALFPGLGCCCCIRARNEARACYLLLVPIPFSLCSIPLSTLGSSCLVLVVTPEDGRQNLVSMATSVCHSVLKRQLQVKDIGTTLVASRITGLYVCVCVLGGWRESKDCG